MILTAPVEKITPFVHLTKFVQIIIRMWEFAQHLRPVFNMVNQAAFVEESTRLLALLTPIVVMLLQPPEVASLSVQRMVKALALVDLIQEFAPKSIFA